MLSDEDKFKVDKSMIITESFSIYDCRWEGSVEGFCQPEQEAEQLGRDFKPVWLTILQRIKDSPVINVITCTCI